MARVGVSINVTDLSEGGLRSLRENLERVDRQIRGTGGRINVTLNDQDTVEGADRIQRAIREIPNHVHVRVRISESGEDSSRIMRSLRRTFAPAGGMVSGILEDGIGQGLLDGFRNAAKNPVVLAGFAAIIMSAVSMVGAAVAGVLAIAFGGAFVALGGFLASKSKEVKRHWKSAADDVKKSWQDAGGAMEPVINHGIDLLSKLADSFLPHFKDAMDNAQMPLEHFLNSVAAGIKHFGQRAFKPMMDGFDALMLAFGPVFDAMMQGMGDSFGALGRTVRNHSGEIAAALGMILGLITTIVDIINFLAVTWSYTMRVATAACGYLTKYGLRTIADGALWVAKVATSAFDLVFGTHSRAKVDAFAAGVHDKLTAMGDSAINWGIQMDRANRKRVLQADISGWTVKLGKARADLKKTTGTKARAKLTADISNLEAKIKKARKEVHAINGLTAVTYVQMFRKASSADKNADGVPDSIARKRTGGVVGMATGGLARASAATRGVLVGEAGPEILHGVPAGSRVTPAGATRSLMQQGGGETDGRPIYLIVDGKVLAKAMFNPWREEVRNRGGISKVVG